MKDRYFLDTNILIYLYSNDDIQKKNIVVQLCENDSLVISTQVLIEFSNVCFRKFNLSVEDVRKTVNELIGNFQVHQNTNQTILKALDIRSKSHYSWFDSLILAAALESNCNIIFTEDMQNGQSIDKSLLIDNPFITAS